MPNYGDWQLKTYLDGLTGTLPKLPMSYPELERQAEQKLSAQLWSYVAGGAGDERTQEANCRTYRPNGSSPTPLMMAPVGVIGLCHPDGHGDLATARASAATGVPMIASTLMQDRLEDVAAATGDTPPYFQLYPPNDRQLTESLVRYRALADPNGIAYTLFHLGDLTRCEGDAARACALLDESLVRRAEAAGYAAIVVTLDTTMLGWRPRDLTLASFPQLKGLCLANYFTDPVFRAQLASPPEEDVAAAIIAACEATTGRSPRVLWARLFGNPGLSWDDLAWLRSLTQLPLLLKGICSPDDVRRAVSKLLENLYLFDES